MTERPILFSAAMVRALLAGTKTQTRRVLKPWSGPASLRSSKTVPTDLAYLPDGTCYRQTCPYGQDGDALWVRESWKAHTTFDHLPPRDIPQSKVWYLSDDGYKAESRTRASIHMPRWASRITLEITEVRVERLQAIREPDARAEGVDYDPGEGGTFWVPGAGCTSDSAGDAYRKLFESINGPGSWDANPWVWALSFRMLAP